MYEFLIEEDSLTEAYHRALKVLNEFGVITPCPDWNTTQKELSMTIVANTPLQEPMISKLFIGGPEELEQYRQEMLDGILDFEIYEGNWAYTYHDRMVNYPIDNIFEAMNNPSLDQIQFVIDELKRNPYSRRAVILIRDPSVDAFSEDPACLQHIQYFVRKDKLHCKVLFRSNDACKATFMNMFALIMLQKRIADELGYDVGTYTHRANSFHCYEKDFDLLEGYVSRYVGSKDEYDVCYDYKDEWEELMLDAQPMIAKKVEELKNR